MSTVSPLPDQGSIFVDARGAGRALRVTWHHESGLVVLSLWREISCVATFRLAIDEVPELIDALRSGLVASYETARDRISEAAPA